MKATMVGGVLMMAAVSGCATLPRSLAENEPTPMSLTSCEPVTGSRIRREGDCTAVGYRLRQFSTDQLRGTGRLDLREALRSDGPAIR